jgi:hypothetical protein
MSARPVPGGAAPVAPDAPAPHVLRARVVDRDRPALLASGSAHPGGSGQKRPIPARTAVVLGDDATSGADVQTNLLSWAGGRTAGLWPATTDPSSTRSCTPPWLGGDDRATRATTSTRAATPLGARHAPQRNMASSPARRKELVAQENSYQ